MPQGRLCKAHANARPVVQERMAGRARVVLDGVGPWHDVTVLDVGCRSGGLIILPSICGARVADIDAASELIEFAAYQVPGGAFRVCDPEDLPYVDTGFATVAGMTAIRYAADPVHA